MNFTDTHTHLYSQEFDSDFEQTIKRALDSGVQHMILPSIDSTFTQSMYCAQEKFPEHLHLMIGLHPCHVKAENYLEELSFIEQQLKAKKFVAIGEIGLDLYWDASTLEIQKEAFVKQIQLAKKHQLPINIHCRDAFHELFEVLEAEKSSDLFGVLHCFTGNLEQAQKAISYQLKLGIGGVVTFKNGKIDTFLNQIPLENIVLETDAPYLAPSPYRGKRNESSYLPLVAQKLAEVYNVSLEEIAKTTSKNANDIFKYTTN